MIDRRRFIKAASLSGLGLAGGAYAMQHPTSVRELVDKPLKEDEEDEVIPIALQLYSVRDDCAADLPGTVAKVAKLGYDGVEFAGYYGYSAEDIRRILDDNGLKCAGTHIGIDTLLGDALAPTIEFHQTIGCKFLIVPGLGPEYSGSKENWLKAAEAFNSIAEALKPVRMWTGYHNHTTEFVPLESGELPWDIFFGNTSKDVCMQFDTGNAMHAQAEATTYLERYPGRARTIHCKAYSADNPDAMIGEDDVPWPRVIELCETIGNTEWYIIEQESYPYPPLECAERCLNNLKEILGR